MLYFYLLILHQKFEQTMLFKNKNKNPGHDDLNQVLILCRQNPPLEKGKHISQYDAALSLILHVAESTLYNIQIDHLLLQIIMTYLDNLAMFKTRFTLTSRFFFPPLAILQKPRELTVLLQMLFTLLFSIINYIILFPF